MGFAKREQEEKEMEDLFMRENTKNGKLILLDLDKESHRNHIHEELKNRLELKKNKIKGGVGKRDKETGKARRGNKLKKKRIQNLEIKFMQRQKISAKRKK